MAPAKTYALSTTNKKRTKAIITDVDSQNPLYTFDLTFITGDIKRSPDKHSITMQTAVADPPKTIGVADIQFSSLSTPIHIGFGDPSNAPNDVVWEDLKVTKKITAGNIMVGSAGGFELNVDLGSPYGRKTFIWKRTGSIEGVGVASGVLDWLHLKMVEKESGEVVAWFRHHFRFGKKRGVFAMEEFEGGSEWEGIVLLTGCAVLEYMRKMSGWSW